MDGKVVIGTELNTKSFDAQIKQLESKLELLEKSADETNIPEKFRRSADEARELNVEIEKTRNQLGGLYEKQAKINSQGFSNMQQSIENIGNSMGNVVKKVAKWGLAVFGIRSIYLGIRQAVSQIMQEDEALRYQIEYIKYSIGQAIKPIVEFIVGLVYKIVAGVGALIKLIFGVNIFAKATAQNFKKAQGSAQKLRKTIAGFDELDIINENGTTGIGGAIDQALEGMGDINEEVDNIAFKIKSWFWGSDNPDEWNIVDSVKNGMKYMGDILQTTYDNYIKPFYDNYLEPYVVKPILRVVDTAKEELRPIWEPMKDRFIEILENDLKPRWEQFKNLIKDKIEELRPVWEPVRDGFIEAKNNILRLFAPFINTLIDGFNGAFGWLGWHLDYIEIEAEETGEEILDEVGGSIEDVNNMQFIDKGFTVNINADTSQAERKTTSWIDDIWNNIVGITTHVENIGLKNLGLKIANATTRLPRLASGGIINNPGPGVMMGSYIGGEKGPEAVLPLTDDTLQKLANMIPITVNLTNNMNGRVISRELQKVQNESDFAFNR